jgi:hypothetical protein
MALVLLTACTAAAGEEEVLAGWVEGALIGDVEAAGSLMADSVSFPFGESVDSWIDGAEPYGAYDVRAICESDEETATCHVTWQDSWIDAYDELTSGSPTVAGSVEDGRVTSLAAFEFEPALRFAMNEHAAWLQTHRRVDYDLACRHDVFARSCSELLVKTVGEWQEH